MTINKNFFVFLFCTLATIPFFCFSGMPESYDFFAAAEQQHDNNILAPVAQPEDISTASVLKLIGSGVTIAGGSLVYGVSADLARFGRCLDPEYHSSECGIQGSAELWQGITPFIATGTALATAGTIHLVLENTQKALTYAQKAFINTQETLAGIGLLYSRIRFLADPIPTIPVRPSTTHTVITQDNGEEDALEIAPVARFFSCCYLS